MLYPIRYIFIVVFVFITTAATISAQTNSITLTWDPNDPAEQVTEYRLYYKTGTSGPPYNGVGLDQGDSPITIRVDDLVDENNPEFNLTGLNTGVTYRLALTAFNGSESGHSDEVSYASQASADLDHVEIEGSQTVPENSTSQFTLRAFLNNSTHSQVNATSWEVNCADASISSDGVLTTRDVTVNTKCTVSATYFSEGLTRTDQMDITIEDTIIVALHHIEISGPGSVDENSSATYNCIAHYTDGSNEQVSSETWDTDCPAEEANISINGVLSTGEVDNNTQCTISARYLSQSNEMGINIRNSTTAATLNRVIIEGPDGVDEGSSTTFTCRAYYSDGSNQIVTPDNWNITDGTLFAEITSEGTLSTDEVYDDETIGIMASFTEGQSTRSDEIQVIVKDTNTPPPTSPNEITIDNGDPGTSYTGRWKTNYSTSFGSPSVYCPYRKKGAYTFSTELYGDYEVSFRWIRKKGKNKNVKVKIFDDDALIDIVTINQRQNPDEWDQLGTYRFNGPVRVRVIANKWEPAVSVDGMKFSRQ